MAVPAENSAEQSRFIRPRNRNRSRSQPITPPNPRPKTHLPKPTSSTLFSSIFSSSSSTTTGNTHNASSPPPSGRTNKMNKFTSMAFNRLGCGSLSPTTLPDVIQSAADREAKKARKQKRRKKKRSSVQALKKTANNGNGTSSPVVVEVVSDVFCAPPGIGFSSDAAFVDCVEPRRPVARRKHRKHYGNARRDRFPVLDSPYGLDSDAFNASPYHLLPQYFPGGLSENMMSQGRIAFEGVLDVYDRFGELRLDVDNMSYEELLDLSDKIGYVGTGLREEKIFHCLRKARLPDLETIPLLPPKDRDSKCSICQDEYEENDEVGKLECGHCYHIGCIKPWLQQKNSCPICKAAADRGYCTT